jgi:hypothetical protein
MNKIIAAIAAFALLGLATLAYAQEPVQLSEQQMDSVTAGAITGGVVNLGAFATGRNAATETAGFAFATQLPIHHSHLTFGVVVAGGSSVSSN